MEYMSKEEMIKYIKDYAYIMNFAAQVPNMPINTVFNLYMTTNCRPKDNTREYYDNMRIVYSLYCMMKSYSFTEDYLLNRDKYISNDSLVGLLEGLTSKDIPNNISNIKVVQLIRNAFNHNDSPTFDRFKISKDTKHIGIEFQDLRTAKEKANGAPEKPFKINFTTHYLFDIYKSMNKNAETIKFITYDIPVTFNINSKKLKKELDKIKFIHYNIPEKLTPEQTNKIKELSDVRHLSNIEKIVRSRQLNKYIKSIGTKKEYKLTEEQKDKIVELMNRYKENSPVFLKQPTSTTMYYFLNEVIPIPALKERNLYNQMLISGAYLDDNRLSQEEIRRRIVRALNKEEIPDYYDEEDKAIHQGLIQSGQSNCLKLLKDMTSPEFIQTFPLIMYIDSVVTHLCQDETITINDQTYEKEKIRNSFAHGRWFISKDQELVMYDADPRNVNEYNLEYIGKIPVDDFNAWAENYQEKYEKLTSTNKHTYKKDKDN